MNKLYLKLLLCFGVLGLGLLCGMQLYSLQWKCLDFSYKKHRFYAPFAQELAQEMQKRGYILQCPDMLPKTNVVFYLENYNKPKVVDEPHQTNIAFIADCMITTLDVEYLRSFDAMLNVNEFNNGYLSLFNFRTAYFPLANENEIYCDTNYKSNRFNIPMLAQRLDEIIQGVRHEKF